jgi:hypothetical protein
VVDRALLGAPPAEACGEYESCQGHTWIKDLDMKHPNRPLAFVWSHTTKRWRTKREMVRMDRVKMFAREAINDQ